MIYKPCLKRRLNKSATKANKSKRNITKLQLHQRVTTNNSKIPEKVKRREREVRKARSEQSRLKFLYKKF
jgi:hypothetical protein